jgi:hypothetical protein
MLADPPSRLIDGSGADGRLRALGRLCAIRTADSGAALAETEPPSVLICARVLARY